MDPGRVPPVQAFERPPVAGRRGHHRAPLIARRIVGRLWKIKYFGHRLHARSSRIVPGLEASAGVEV